MPATWQPRPEAESLRIISVTCGKENQWEQCKWFALLDFCGSCLRLMTSWNTRVYRYHGIFETVYYRRYIIAGQFLIPRIPTLTLLWHGRPSQQLLSSCSPHATTSMHEITENTKLPTTLQQLSTASVLMSGAPFFTCQSIRSTDVNAMHTMARQQQ